MKCELSETLLHGYVDGELDAAGAVHFERHLESCAECAGALAREQILRQTLQSSSLYERAPHSLRQRILSSLPAAPESQRTAGSFSWLWPAVAAASLLFSILSWQFFPGSGRQAQQATLASAIVDAHLRSLQPGHLTDVASTDQHTVKPWFDGKLEVVPPVQDFANEGFPLIGGRLDIVDGRTVAALVYARRKHIVNVFVWRAQDGNLPSGSGTEQGYHWSSWQREGLTFCGVTDASPADLDELKQLFLQH